MRGKGFRDDDSDLDPTSCGGCCDVPCGTPVLLKFSGRTVSESTSFSEYLADTGSQNDSPSAPAYPVPALNVTKLRTNLLTASDGTIVLELLVNGIGTGLKTTYTAGETGIKSAAPTVPLLVPDGSTIDLRLTATVTTPGTFRASATLSAKAAA